MLEELETVDEVDLSDLETSQLASGGGGGTGSKRARARSRTSTSIKKRAMMSSRDKLFHFYENNDRAMVRNVSLKIGFWMNRKSQTESQLINSLKQNELKLHDIKTRLARTFLQKQSNLAVRFDDDEEMSSPDGEETEQERKTERQFAKIDSMLADVRRLIETTEELSSSVPSEYRELCWDTTLSDFIRSVPKNSSLMDLLMLHSRRSLELEEKLVQLSEKNAKENCMSGGRYDFNSWDKRWHANKRKGKKGVYNPMVGFGVNLNDQIPEIVYEDWAREQAVIKEQFYNVTETDFVPCFRPEEFHDIVGSSITNSCNDGTMSRTFEVYENERRVSECQIRTEGGEGGKGGSHNVYSEVRHLKVDLSEFCRTNNRGEDLNEDVLDCMISNLDAKRSKLDERTYSIDCHATCALLMSYLGLFPRTYQ